MRFALFLMLWGLVLGGCERKQRDYSTPCATDNECPAHQFCTPSSQCATGCLVDEHCDGDDYCDPHGRCLSSRGSGVDPAGEPDMAPPPPPDMTVPPGCGNGVLEAGEACDDGAANADSATAACTTACRRRASCGNVSGAARTLVDAQNGHCYVAWAGPGNWSEAQAACRSQGGALASATSDGEADLLATFAGASAHWIGLTRGKTGFVWPSGEAMTTRRFVNGEPDAAGSDNDCVAATSAGWTAEPCGWPSTGFLPSARPRELPFVCESGCGNGVVEPGEECDETSPACNATCRRVRACPDGVIAPESGHCYFVRDAATFYGDVTCPAGSHLATLESAAEVAAVRNLVTKTMWIALRAPNDFGAFSWEAPSALDFNPRRWHGFLENEPNYNGIPGCGTINAGGRWADGSCFNNLPALCEAE